MRKTAFYLAILSFPVLSAAQNLKKDERALAEHLKKHIQFLASDQLQGRLAGSEGEKKAAEYISAEFQGIGLTPKGTGNYYQNFEIDEGKQVGSGSYLTLNGNSLLLNKDFYPLYASPSATIESSSSLALKESGTPWFYEFKDLVTEDNINKSIDEIILEKTRQAKSRGASALLLYSSGMDDNLKFNAAHTSEILPLPVILIKNQAARKYLNDESATIDIKLRIQITDKKRNAVNVIGYIDKGAPLTVILGAHFDHLGLGENGNSRELHNKGQIHNGADDNASGTAALIELARLIKDTRLKNYNYLFIAFSGEEEGLLGSKYFTEHPTVDLSRINYMINMDMVGRLNDSSHVLIIGGYGTSPSWGNLYSQKGKHGLFTGDLTYHFDSSGTGPSDHTSFYLKDIPVLFYFTGIHPDYHMPTDDFDKINYNGEAEVIKHIYSLVETEDKLKSRLSFSRTRQKETGTEAHFNVTLGFMPDYSFNGTGVRIDDIIENKPAQKGGLKKGDIILSLGSYKIPSLEQYMQALGKFKKGERTTVTYSRNNQIFTANVEF